MKLFSYVIPEDHGAAPNPFWGVCTLVICKPRIRSAAQVDDWIVGTGSKHSSIGDIRAKLVYAMRVTDKMPMHEYDAWAQEHRPEKVPDWSSGDRRRWVGDAIYDFSTDPPSVRPSVYGPDDRVRDLGGKYALLSEHFFYFGDQPATLPEDLRGLVHSGQAHSSDRNAKYLDPFVDWLTGLGLQHNRLYGRPQKGPLSRQVIGTNIIRRKRRGSRSSVSTVWRGRYNGGEQRGQVVSPCAHGLKRRLRTCTGSRRTARRSSSTGR